MWLPAPARWTRRVSGPAPAASSRARRERSGPRKVRYFDFTVITEPPSFTRSMEGVREFGPGLKGWSRRALLHERVRFPRTDLLEASESSCPPSGSLADASVVRFKNEERVHPCGRRGNGRFAHRPHRYSPRADAAPPRIA